ncbi:MAG: class I SAM-dependent methyltransferase [Actinomycetes bacterium]
MPTEIDELSPLGDRYRDVLLSMYDGAPQRGADGRSYAIDGSTRVSLAEGMTLHSLCVTDRVTATLEVGLAYGFSAVFLLAALDRVGGGTHTAIDPFQMTDWHGIGMTHASELTAQSATLTSRSFTWIEDRSDRALVDLERAGRTCGLVFIDGYHRFDDVLVDFTLSARMCRSGGLIVLHDMWLDSIKAVASFVRNDRPDFAEVTTPCDNLFVVRRVGEDERDWSHFVDFPLR